jgi:hypothetical protein
VLAGRYPGGKPGAVWYERAGGAARDVAAGKAVLGVHASGARLFAVHEDGLLDLLEGEAGAVRGTAKLPFVPYAFFIGGPRFVDRGAELCSAHADGDRVEAVCLDTALRARFALREPLGGTGGTLPERGVRWVVAGTTRTKQQRSLVIDLATGAVVSRVDAEVAATVRDGAGELGGLFVTRPSTQLLDRGGQVRWTSPERLEEAASALQKDGTIFVASFDRITNGASLTAFDERTGAVRWRGDLKLLQVTHSIYRNHVDLDFDHGDVVMRGHESAQEYLEIFAPADGAPLFRLVQGRGSAARRP